MKSYGEASHLILKQSPCLVIVTIMIIAKKNNDTDDNEINYDNNDNDDTDTTATGSGHETAAVLLPGFAINGIAKLGNKTATVPWHDLTTNENDNNDHNNNVNDDTNTTATFNHYTLPLL